MKHLVAAMLLFAPQMAQAQTTASADRATAAEVAALPNRDLPDLPQLDALLVRLPRPTPDRGIVQMARALKMSADKDLASAVAAIDESLRLLPEDPRPKLTATRIFTFAGAPQRAADLWMEASRIAPALARTSDPYVMSALTDRLVELGDRTRADRSNARLSEIGFSAGLAPERSAAALARARAALLDGRTDDARLAVTAITDPDDLLTLYVDRRYAALWPRIAEWAGPDLAGQSLRYLEELRGDWVAGDDFRTAVPYAGQLAKLDAQATLVTLFLPLFDRLRPGADLNDVEYLGPPVARALARLGRGAEARALLARVAAALPPNRGVNALNIDVAYLTLAVLDADWPQVIALGDGFLARAIALGDAINRFPILQAQAWRACALFRTGRAAEAEQAAAAVVRDHAVAPALVMDLYLCRGDVAAARALVIARMEDEATRGWALRFVQPTGPYTNTPFERVKKTVAKTVRAAPDVVAAANRWGRILPRPVDASVPTSFDPFRVQPRPRAPGSDAI